jgi:hypothetical protein
MLPNNEEIHMQNPSTQLHIDVDHHSLRFVDFKSSTQGTQQYNSLERFLLSQLQLLHKY